MSQVDVITGLLKRHGEDVREVALLTPYRAQLGVLRRAAQRELDEKALLTVTFATVDGFQVHIAACGSWGEGLTVKPPPMILCWVAFWLTSRKALQLDHAQAGHSAW